MIYVFCTRDNVHDCVYSGDSKAQPYTLTQGKLLAMVAVDVLCNPGLVDTMKAQLQEALEKGE